MALIKLLNSAVETTIGEFISNISNEFPDLDKNKLHEIWEKTNMAKKCSICEEEKPKTNEYFSWSHKDKGIFQAHCKGISKKELNLAIKIQSYYRGYRIRKQNKKLDDGMSFSLLNSCIDSYITTIVDEKKINASLKLKKIRLSNFPSHISENIAKFAICKKYGIMPNWDTGKGDLLIDKLHTFKRCEVKGSINLSNGPPTFGPAEEWDYIYFVDGVNNDKKIYRVYEFKLSNKCEMWQNIKVNKTETYHDQCLQKRRPRITFKELKLQIGNHCNLIFDGHISELDNTV